MMPYRSVAVAGVLLLCVLRGPANAQWQLASVCPKPSSPLSHVTKDVDRETAPVTEGEANAQLDIASAFASESNGNGSSWCVRYEVLNQGPSPIAKVWWPLAGLMVQNAQPHPPSPDSVVVTLPPGGKPTVKDTVLYAFKSQAVHTRTYQRTAAIPSYRELLRLAVAPGQTGKPSDAPSAPDVVTVGNSSSLPELGAEFTGSDADVGVASNFRSNGGIYIFTISIGRNSEKDVMSISAPFTTALDEKYPNGLLDRIRKYRTVPLPLPLHDNSYRTTLAVSIQLTQPPPIYIVRQPVTLVRLAGQVCFLVPTYFPEPVPADLQSCD